MKYEQLKELLPRYYEKSKEMDAVVKVEGGELDKLVNSIKDVMTQTYPYEATWGLDRLEGIFGIEPQEGDSYADRRARLISKIQFSSPLTPYQFKTNLGGFAENVGIEQYYSEYRVEFFLEKATFNRLSIMIKTIKEMIPAHLEWDIALKYPGTIGFDTTYFRGWSSFIYANEFDSGEYWSSGYLEKPGPVIGTTYGSYNAEFKQCGPSGAFVYKTTQAITSVFSAFEIPYLRCGTFNSGEVSL